MNILVEGSRGKSGMVEMAVQTLEELGESVVGKITGKPEIIIIPNIRFEHQDGLGPNIQEQAKNFNKIFKISKTLFF